MFGQDSQDVQKWIQDPPIPKFIHLKIWRWIFDKDKFKMSIDGCISLHKSGVG